MASASAFKPYGLINTLAKDILYQNALAEEKMKDTREYQASALTCGIMLPFFQEDKYAYCPEFPPAPHYTGRMDHNYRYIVTGEQKLRHLIFVEVKRAGQNILNAEEQVQNYCSSFANYYKKRVRDHPEELELEQLYAITVTGIWHKFWMYHPISKVFEPLSQGSPKYLNPGDSKDAELFKQCIQYIKNNPPFGESVPDRRYSGDDHSKYSEGSEGPTDEKIRTLTASGYVSLTVNRMEFDKESGTVFYYMINEQGNTIVVKGDQWKRSTVKVGGKEVDHCFTVIDPETGAKYYVWRLEEVNFKNLPLRSKVGEITPDELEPKSEDEITDVDPNESTEVILHDLEFDEEGEITFFFTLGESEIRFLDSDLTRAFVTKDEVRTKCVKFETDGRIYHCCESEAFHEVIEKAQKRKEKGKAKATNKRSRHKKKKGGFIGAMFGK